MTASATGRTVYGWAAGIMERRLNPEGLDRPRIPMFSRHDRPGAVERYDDQCRVRDSPVIHASSVHGPDDRFVVFIVDRQIAYHRPGYSINFEAQKRNFGGSWHADTLDEAVAAYDRIRGATPEQLDLFGDVA